MATTSIYIILSFYGLFLFIGRLFGPYWGFEGRTRFFLACPKCVLLTFAANRNEHKVSPALASAGETLTNISVLQLPPKSRKMSHHRVIGCFKIFTERVLEDKSQAAITKWDVVGFVSQRSNDIS